ncbi:restriction endonuclease [Arthrobacter sp. W1]|nr:restriction endonuclease [Arthrobacter sp. W1]
MDKKFDVVIGNPPYQEESTGDATHAMPIYHEFMDAAYEVGHKAVLITPARFLFNAGYTPKAWNEKMLKDGHLSVPYYEANSNDLFPGTAIPGGIAVTYRDEEVSGAPIGVFNKFMELTQVLQKVQRLGEPPLSSVITSSRSYAYTDEMHAAHPEAASIMAKGEKYKINTRAFELLPFLYHEELPSDSKTYLQVYGLINRRRVSRWILGEYIDGPGSLFGYKIALPKSRGHLGTLGSVPALMIGEPFLAEPKTAVTQTYLTIGNFSIRSEAEACFKYIKSKFARTLLALLKVTQDNPARVWAHVPMQDFTSTSDVNWSKSISEIDQQLYKKYGLEESEIDFIESKIKAMD